MADEPTVVIAPEVIEHGHEAAKQVAAVVDAAYAGKTATMIGEDIASKNRLSNESTNNGIKTFVDAVRDRKINTGTVTEL